MYMYIYIYVIIYIYNHLNIHIYTIYIYSPFLCCPVNCDCHVKENPTSIGKPFLVSIFLFCFLPIKF